MIEVLVNNVIILLVFLSKAVLLILLYEVWKSA